MSEISEIDAVRDVPFGGVARSLGYKSVRQDIVKDILVFVKIFIMIDFEYFLFIPYLIKRKLYK